MQHSEDPILISGGTGLIGTALVEALRVKGQRCLILSRQGGRSHAGVPVISYAEMNALPGASALVNLAGADIAGGRWSLARKTLLRQSRIATTQRLCAWAQQCARPPSVMLSASAIGYYGDTGEEAVDEGAGPGSDFGAQLCRDWEQSIQMPDATRVVRLRIGVVLTPQGGALQRMLPAFRLGLGGRLGSGQQWMSWIALEDLLQILLAALRDDRYSGAYNAVAPQPVRNIDFTRALGRALGRPTVFPVPAVLLRLALGEMSSLLLGSQRVLPQRLMEQDLQFRAPDIDTALKALRT